MKRCKVCKAEFIPAKPMQKVCSLACALSMVAMAKAKRNRRTVSDDLKMVRAKLDGMKSKAALMREALSAFNRWVRLRDAKEPCISCGRHHKGQYHAGHFLSRGAHPELAFEPLNVHKQCAPCNTHLSGNVSHYRPRLAEKIGQESVDWLEGPHPQKHYTCDDLRAIKTKYAAKARELEKAHG